VVGGGNLSGEMTLFLAALLKPIGLLLLFLPAAAARVVIQRKMKDGKLKAFLLR
jgi:hypothetical protein